jgi:hypothetical protein
MNTIPSPTNLGHAASYGRTRFNALRHGVLSRYTVLPWEDEGEYRDLLNALVAEHAPKGPTEEHLIEELAGIIWRKRRLRMVEAAVYRDKLRRDTTAYSGGAHIAGAALLPITGNSEGNASISQALTATPAETARDLRDVKRAIKPMTRRAWNILHAGGGGAYERALAELGEDTRDYWQQSLADPPDDGLTYAANAEALKAWIDQHWKEWYDWPISELQHRDAIRDQALGMAYGTDDLERPARYEVHLDRKLERVLVMLVRLQDLRRPSVSE